MKEQEIRCVYAAQREAREALTQVTRRYVAAQYRLDTDKAAALANLPTLTVQMDGPGERVAAALPETLLRLAERLPEHVRWDGNEYDLSTWEGPRQGYVRRASIHPDAVLSAFEEGVLLTVLRQEIEARGLHWITWTSRWTLEYEPPYYGRVEGDPIVQADSPAHALALALLAALDGAR